MRIAALLLVCLLATGCEGVRVTTTVSPPRPQATRDAEVPPSVRAWVQRNFIPVADDVMTVAERACRQETRNRRCDYGVIILASPDAPPNAFQTQARDGRPIIGITVSLMAITRNADELAFILGHEAAHHIEGHIGRGRVSASESADLFGQIVARAGGSEIAIAEAQNLGAFYGSRRYARRFELEADALGARIAAAAGYDPLRGVAFFEDAPDPGNVFLGTHPPNADRIDVVRQVVARL